MVPHGPEPNFSFLSIILEGFWKGGSLFSAFGFPTAVFAVVTQSWNVNCGTILA